MASGSLEAATGTTESIRVVGLPCAHSVGFPPGLPATHYCLQSPGLLGHEAGKDVSFDPGITGMC